MYIAVVDFHHSQRNIRMILKPVLFFQAAAGKNARALYDYQAEGEDEISFDPDDIIENVEEVWWHNNELL